MFNSLTWGDGDWPSAYQAWDHFRYPVYADMPEGTFSLQLAAEGHSITIPLRTLKRDVFRFIALVTPTIMRDYDHLVLKDLRAGDVLLYIGGRSDVEWPLRRRVASPGGDGMPRSV